MPASLKFSVTRIYKFAAAHSLPFVPDTHKCKRMHGHNYKFEVQVEQAAPHVGGLRQDGMVLDFFDLDAIVDPIVKTVDHFTLNAIPGLENPTAENIAVWLMDQVADLLPASLRVISVCVHEEEDCRATAWHR